uniref:golgin subfamily B member 1-like isoform X2 n=1 Tax=Myxine glutinosa TaxID=7769 RepID=UPI00358F8FE9
MESAHFGNFAAADRATLRELNTRLARYVEHVQRLEARNRALRSELVSARRRRGTAPDAVDARDAEVRRSRDTVRALSVEVARDALLRERLRGERAWRQGRLQSEERELHELRAASEAALHQVEKQHAFGAELEAGAERIARDMEGACEAHAREMSAWRARLQQLERVSVFGKPVNVFPTEEELFALENAAAKAGLEVAERLEGELVSYTEEVNHEQVQKQEMDQEVAGLAQTLQRLQLKATEERAEDLDQESSEFQMVVLKQSRESRELADAEMQLRLEIAAYRSMLQMECGDPLLDEKERQLRIQQKGLWQQQKKSWMHGPHKYYQRTDVGPSLKAHAEVAKANRRRHDWICNQRVKTPTKLSLNHSQEMAFGLSRSKKLSGESASRSPPVKIQHSMEGTNIQGTQKEQKSDVSIYKIKELSEQSSKVCSKTEITESKVHDIVPAAYEMDSAPKYIEDPNRIGTIEEKEVVESGDLSAITYSELLKEDAFETTSAAENGMESCSLAISDKQKDEDICAHGTDSVAECPEECEETSFPNQISDEVDKTDTLVASLPPEQQETERETQENTAIDSEATDVKEQYFPIPMETEPLEEQYPQPFDSCAETEEPVPSPSSKWNLDEQPAGISDGDNVFTYPEYIEEQNTCERWEATTTTTHSTDVQLMEKEEEDISLDLPENPEKDYQDRNDKFDLELPSPNKICAISTIESQESQEDDINIIEGLDKQYIYPERISFSPEDKDASFQLHLEMKPESEEESLQPQQEFLEIANKEEAYSGTCDDVCEDQHVSPSRENITESVTEVTETLKMQDSEAECPEECEETLISDEVDKTDTHVASLSPEQQGTESETQENTTIDSEATDVKEQHFPLPMETEPLEEQYPQPFDSCAEIEEPVPSPSSKLNLEDQSVIITDGDNVFTYPENVEAEQNTCERLEATTTHSTDVRLMEEEEEVDISLDLPENPEKDYQDRNDEFDLELPSTNKICAISTIESQESQEDDINIIEGLDKQYIYPERISFTPEDKDSSFQLHLEMKPESEEESIHPQQEFLEIAYKEEAYSGTCDDVCEDQHVSQSRENITESVTEVTETLKMQDSEAECPEECEETLISDEVDKTDTHVASLSPEQQGTESETQENTTIDSEATDVKEQHFPLPMETEPLEEQYPQPFDSCAEIEEPVPSPSSKLNLEDQSVIITDGDNVFTYPENVEAEQNTCERLEATTTHSTDVRLMEEDEEVDISLDLPENPEKDYQDRNDEFDLELPSTNKICAISTIESQESQEDDINIIEGLDKQYIYPERISFTPEDKDSSFQLHLEMKPESEEESIHPQQKFLEIAYKEEAYSGTCDDVCEDQHVSQSRENITESVTEVTETLKMQDSEAECPEECEETLISDEVDKTDTHVASLSPEQQGTESETQENTAIDSEATDVKEQYFPLPMETEPLEEQYPQPFDSCAETEEPVPSPSSKLNLEDQSVIIGDGDNVFTYPENVEGEQNTCERLKATITHSTDVRLMEEEEEEVDISLDLPENPEKDYQDRNDEFDLELPSTNKICAISTIESQESQEDDINIIEGLDKQYIYPERISFTPEDKDSSFQLHLEMKPESEEESLHPQQEFLEIAYKEEAYSGTCDDVCEDQHVSQSRENITESVTEVTETLKMQDSEAECPEECEETLISDEVDKTDTHVASLSPEQQGTEGETQENTTIDSEATDVKEQYFPLPMETEPLEEQYPQPFDSCAETEEPVPSPSSKLNLEDQSVIISDGDNVFTYPENVEEEQNTCERLEATTTNSTDVRLMEEEEEEVDISLDLPENPEKDYQDRNDEFDLELPSTNKICAISTIESQESREDDINIIEGLDKQYIYPERKTFTPENKDSSFQLHLEMKPESEEESLQSQQEFLEIANKEEAYSGTCDDVCEDQHVSPSRENITESVTEVTETLKMQNSEAECPEECEEILISDEVDKTNTHVASLSPEQQITESETQENTAIDSEATDVKEQYFPLPMETEPLEEQYPQGFDSCAEIEEPVPSPSSKLNLEDQSVMISDGDKVFTYPENVEEEQNTCERLEATTTHSTDVWLMEEEDVDISLDLPENPEKDYQDRNDEFDLELPSTNKICAISTIESQESQEDDINIIEGLDKQYIYPERISFSPEDKDSSFQLHLEMKPESEEESLQLQQEFLDIAHKEEAYSGMCDDVCEDQHVSQSRENITESVTEVTETLKMQDSEVEDFTISVETLSSMSPHSKEDDHGKTYGTTEEIHELHINESSEEEPQSSHESVLQMLESTSEAEHILEDKLLELPHEVQEISIKELKLEEPFSTLSGQTPFTKEAGLRESSEMILSEMLECNVTEQEEVIFKCEEEKDNLTLTRAGDENYYIEEEEECVRADAPTTSSSLKFGDYQEMVHSEEDNLSQKEEPDQMVIHESHASQNEPDVTSDANNEIGEEIKVFGHKHLFKHQLPMRLLTDNVPEVPVDFTEEAPDHCKETLPDISTSDLERSLPKYQITASESVPETTGTEICVPGLKKENEVESRYMEVEADVPENVAAQNVVGKETKERKKRLRRRGKKNHTPLAHRSDNANMKSNLQQGDIDQPVDQQGHKSEQVSCLYEESVFPHEEVSTLSNECELKVSGSLVEAWTEKSDTISPDEMDTVSVSSTPDNVSLKQIDECKDKQELEGAQEESHMHEDMQQFSRADIDSFTGKGVTDSGFVDATVSDMCVLSTSIDAISKSTTSESLQNEGTTFHQDSHEDVLTKECVVDEIHIPESEGKDEFTVTENGLVKTEQEKEQMSYKPEGDKFEEEPIAFSKNKELRNEGEEEQHFIDLNTDDYALESKDSKIEEFSDADEHPGCEDRDYVLVVKDGESFGEQGKENVQLQEYYSKLSNKKDLTEDVSECDVHDKNHNKKFEDQYVDMMDDFQILSSKVKLSGGADDEASLQNVWGNENETVQELFEEGGDDQQVASEMDSSSLQPSLEPFILTESSKDVTHEVIKLHERPECKSPPIFPIVKSDSEEGGHVYVDQVQLTWLSQDTRSFPVVEVISESSTTGIEKSASSLGLQEKEELSEEEEEEQSLKGSKEDVQKFPSEKAYQILETMDTTNISKEVSIDYEKECFDKQYQSSEYVTVSVQPLNDYEQTLLFVEDEQNIDNVEIPEQLESSGDGHDKVLAESQDDEQSCSEVKLCEVTLSDDENRPTTSKNVEEISETVEVKLITTKLSPEEETSLVIEEVSDTTLEEDIHNMSNLFKLQQENGTHPFAEIVLEQTPSKIVDSQSIFIVDEGTEKYPDAQEISDMAQKVEKQDDPALKLKEILRDISTIGAVPLDEATISFGLKQDKVTGSAVIQSPGLFESDSVQTWHEMKKEKQLFHCEDEDSKSLMQVNVEDGKQSPNATISGEFVFEQTGEGQEQTKEEDEEEGEEQTLRSESPDNIPPSVDKKQHLPFDELDEHLLSESETTQSTLAAGREQRCPLDEEIPADSKRKCQGMVELKDEECLRPSHMILPNVETQIYADFNQNKSERFTDDDSTLEADTESGRAETSLHDDDNEKELTELESNTELVRSKALDFQVFPEFGTEQSAEHEDFTSTYKAKENKLSGVTPISATCSFGTSDTITQEEILLGNDTPIESDNYHFMSLTQEENILPSLGTTMESSAHPHVEEAPEASATFVEPENQEGFGKEKENEEVAEERDEIDTMLQQNYHSYRLASSSQPVLVDTGERQVGVIFLDESNLSFQGHSLQ